MEKSIVRTGVRRARHGAKLGSMAAAIPAATLITLGHRIPLLLEAAVDAKARRNPELKRMVIEKAKAGAQSAAAFSKGHSAAIAALARFAKRQGEASAEVAAALLGPNPAMALHRLWTQGKISADVLTDLSAQLSEITARTARGALAPAHTRVTANAKRLAAKARAKRVKT